jgi:succinate-semialdehyde dehydrogenase/glutarate-semialdehyde dehydrogenase
MAAAVASMTDRTLFLGGEWTPAARTVEVINPATGDRVGSTSVADPPAVEAAVTAAVRGQSEWWRLGPAERRRILHAVADRVDDAADEIAWLLTREQGKPHRDSLKEVRFGADVFRFYADEAMRLAAELRPSYADAAIRSLVERRPVGVVAAIVPWNYPVDLWCWKVAGALAAGNAVVVKPPLETPLAVAAVVRQIEQVGLPPGCLSDLPGGADIGQVLVTAEGVALVSLTGSVATGQAVVQAAAERLPRLLLELGGHAPFVVLDDADVAEAVSAAARRSFSNMGQICIAVNRVIVAEPAADSFVEAIAAAAAAARPAPTDDPETMYGSMTTTDAKQRTRRHIDDAVGQGAMLVIGGQDPPELRPDTHIQPAVLDHVPVEAAVMNEETFGPVVAIHRVDSEEHALAMANSLPYGLAAYVYSGSLERGWRFADQLEFGMVGVNVNDTTELSAPFGGWKMSGFGSELGHEGLLSYTRPRTIRMKVR